VAILLIPRERRIWRVDRRFETLLESSSGVCGSQYVYPFVMQNYGTSFLLVSENRVQSCQELVKFAESRPKLAI
jgi:hypothetical protein